ncbi:hypothetical protein RJ640_018509 [Escallonia rubra]|uniref:Ubiquitin-like protease family profile domain-containing protein n=1 Tax=Escallonia rubra TaxID=112253 RepID=A0AA88R5P3_9ASTE|nr:hypothetical protein RJ640_018509 [Escallonia rubra]
MGTTSSRKKFSVFEFNEDDERAEKTSRKMLSKFTNPKKQSPIHKYKFLEHTAQGKKAQRKDLRNEPFDVVAVNDDVAKRKSGLDATAASVYSTYRHEAHPCPNGPDFGSLFSVASSFSARGQNRTGRSHLDSTPHIVLDNDPFGVNPCDVSIQLSSSCSSASDVADNEGSLREHVAESGHSGCDDDTIVVISTGYVKYGDKYCSNARLSFSCSSVKLEVSTATAIKELLTYEWAIADVVNIESQWCEALEEAIVNIRLNSKDVEIAGNAETPGVLELNFKVSDTDWLKRQEAIKSLDVRYKDVWNVVSNLEEPFEDFIYPNGDPDAVSISKRDLQLLEPARFINDTIIDFYIKYLESKVKPEEKHRFHFFNTFFFRKLVDLDKDSSRAWAGREAYQHVSKWTRKVNLFEKDYIFIPVNFRCGNGEVAQGTMYLAHGFYERKPSSYLWEEWKERHNELMEDVLANFLNLQFLHLELPQQENAYDCGLFLLHYVELFVEQLNKDWFPPAEASLKRSTVRKLIYELAKDKSLKVPSPAYDSADSADGDKGDTGVEFLHEYSAEKYLGSFSNSNSDQEVDSTPIAAIPLRSVQSFGESGFGELLGSRDNARLSARGNHEPLTQIVSLDGFKNVLSLVEKEDEENGEQTAWFLTDEAGGDQVAEPSATSYSAKKLTEPGISVDSGDYKKRLVPYGSSLGGSPNKSDVPANDEYTPDVFRVSVPEEDDVCEISSTSSERFSGCVVEDSQGESGPGDGSASDVIIASSSQEVNSTDNIDLTADHIQSIDLTADPTSPVAAEVRHREKRLKLMSSVARRTRRQTRVL